MSQRVRGRLSGPNKTLEGLTQLSNCTYCHWGIFTDHKYHWHGGDGLVHNDCSNPRGTNDS